MKKLSLLLVMLLFVAANAIAQRTVSGSITDDAGEPLIGASVLVKNTNSGTVTDIDGSYSITVPEGGNTFVVSYTGYTTQEIALGASNVVDIVLAEGITLSDVVVTALGVKREKKSLGYSTQQVSGDEVTAVKSDNFMNSLSGKIAGVNIRATNNFGGSTDVVIRGHTSLTGNNQALFVVDGVPIENGDRNDGDQSRGQRGYDYGSTMSDINPDDIESINVLKGAAATALYGSRASNGAVIITTKKGSKGKGLGISFSSGASWGNIDKTTFAEYQDEYGAGYGAYYDSDDGYFLLSDVNGDGNQDEVVPLTEDASFGAKFDPNRQVYMWDAFVPESPNYQKSRPWVAAKNTPVEFFETAHTYNNSISFSSGNDKGSFRLGFTNDNSTGVMPNSKSNKNSVNFGSSYDLTDKLTASFSGNFINANTTGRYSTGYSDNILTSFRQWWQTNVDILEQKEIFEKTDKNYTWNFSSPGSFQPIYWDNPYWTRFKNYSSDERNRVFGNVALTYKLTDWLSVTGKSSIDHYSELREERRAVGSVASTFGVRGTNSVTAGYIRWDRNFMETNQDLMLNFDKHLSDNISFLGILGYNFRKSALSTNGQNTEGGLAAPGIYSIKNSFDNVLPALEELQEKAVRGIYASASFGYDNFLYLDLTGRRDESSTLPVDNNTYFYPSATMSLIFSEKMNVDAISFGKIRLNYAEVGNDAPTHAVKTTYAKPSNFNVPLFSVKNTRNNPELKPERTKSLEAGLEMNFFNNRVGFDFSVYKTNSVDQIMPVKVSRSTGNSFKFVNAGEIENKGIELALFATPVKVGDFSWDLNINFARNRNKVISLFDGVDNLVLQSYQGGVTVNATVGQPYGTIRGTGRVTDDNGKFVVDSRGYYTTEDDQLIGNVNPDWTGGIQNTLNWKGLSFGFLIDIKQGGNIFSLDHHYGEGTGIYPTSAGVNDKGNPVRDSPDDGGGILLPNAVDADGNENSTYANYGYYGGAGYWGRGGNDRYTYDASFVKLREVTLNFALPSSLYDTFAQNMSIGLYGRNLWIISKHTPYSDPEDGLGAGNTQGFQSGSFPAVKIVGVKLNIGF